VLLFGAGLFLRSLLNVARTPPGFDRDRLVSVRLDVRAAGYRPAELPALYRRLVDGARSVPGVRLATVALSGIATGSARSSGIATEGQTPRPGGPPDAQENYVGPDYFETVGMPLVRGRGFEPHDTKGSRRVSVINETMARDFFPGKDPIGQRFGYEPGQLDIEVVGVVRDARVLSLRQAAPPLAYHPLIQDPQYVETVDVRTDRDPAAVGVEVRKVVEGIDPRIQIRGVNTLAQQLDRTLSDERLIARLSGLFAVLALALAGLGLYGLSSYGVSRRTREIGVRMAIGATSGAVQRLVLGRTLRLTALGVGLGIPMALVAARAVTAQLYGLSPADPTTLALAVLVVLAIAALSGQHPARRAARLEPTTALRAE
jgi:predicted permease